MAVNRFPFIVNIKHKTKLSKDKKPLTSFDINLNINKPRKHISSNLNNKENIEQENIDTKKLQKTLINGFALLYNKYNDILDYLIKKHKDKKIKLDPNNITLQQSIIKIFGEPREYITFEEYIELLELGYKYSEIIGKQQAGINGFI